MKPTENLRHPPAAAADLQVHHLRQVLLWPLRLIPQDLAVERASAYVKAGADSLFVPGLSELDAV